MLLKMVRLKAVGVACHVMSLVGSVVPGGGAFEVAAHAALTSAEFMGSVQGRAKYGVTVSHCMHGVGVRSVFVLL